MVFSTHPHPTGKVNLQNLVLSPFEALIVELS